MPPTRTISPVPASVLAWDDGYWRRLWRRYGRVNTIAKSLHLHTEDVKIRLKAAGINVVGRPATRSSSVETTRVTAAQADEGAQLLIDGIGV